jgi:hypothetical protein
MLGGLSPEEDAIIDLAGFWGEWLSAFVLRGLVVCVLASAVFVALYLRRVPEVKP